MAVVVFAAAALAQTGAPITFEVATIKPSDPNARGMFMRPSPGGRLTVSNMSVKDMVGFAWGVQPFQISGGPAWIASARFDITAKADGTAKMPELMLMLQSLLRDRFQLAIHKETKELAIYGLVLAKKDGKLGPRLIESKEGGCTPPDPTKPPPPPDPVKGPALACNQLFAGIEQVRGVSVSVQRLLPILSRYFDRKVVDQTGLTGTYDITLEWTPDDAHLAQLPADAPRPADNGPSIFTALQEQLGLKLESQRGPVEMIVIDRAEKPSEN